MPLTIGNIVPLGESDKQVYLTSLAGKGDGLSRTHIFRPGLAPANVTLPDNAWGIGLSIVDVDNGNSVVALARPDKNAFSNVSARRFDNVMNPGSKMVYDVWMEAYVGRWQEGFRIMFAKNMLYDVEPGTFDNTLFEREDLKWVRYGFVGHFASAWHNYFYDVDKGVYVKCLPTEKEWQYAAQAGDGRLYPWGDTIDSTKCNVGNGILDPVRKYPQGANPLGLEELTGSVWQLTNDSYKNATSGFIILKGGDYFTTKSSWWYV